MTTQPSDFFDLFNLPPAAVDQPTVQAPVLEEPVVAPMSLFAQALGMEDENTPETLFVEEPDEECYPQANATHWEVETVSEVEANAEMLPGQSGSTALEAGNVSNMIHSAMYQIRYIALPPGRPLLSGSESEQEAIREENARADGHLSDADRSAEQASTLSGIELGVEDVLPALPGSNAVVSASEVEVVKNTCHSEVTSILYNPLSPDRTLPAGIEPQQEVIRSEHARPDVLFADTDRSSNEEKDPAGIEVGSNEILPEPSGSSTTNSANVRNNIHCVMSGIIDIFALTEPLGQKNVTAATQILGSPNRRFFGACVAAFLVIGAGAWWTLSNKQGPAPTLVVLQPVPKKVAAPAASVAVAQPKAAVATTPDRIANDILSTSPPLGVEATELTPVAEPDLVVSTPAILTAETTSAKPAPMSTKKTAPKPTKKAAPKRQWQDDALDQLDNFEKRL